MLNVFLFLKARVVLVCIDYSVVICRRCLLYATCCCRVHVVRVLILFEKEMHRDRDDLSFTMCGFGCMATLLTLTFAVGASRG